MATEGSSPPTGTDILFASLAKVTDKRVGIAPEVVLALTTMRHLVVIDRGGVAYDWPIAAITALRFPWYTLGAGFICEVNGGKYSVMFDKLSSTARSGIFSTGNVVGDVLTLVRAARTFMDIAGARGLCKNWKAVLEAAQQLTASAT